MDDGARHQSNQSAAVSRAATRIWCARCFTTGQADPVDSPNAGRRPITVVCHSQGNIVGLTAAFFGDAFPDVEDPWGCKGHCVADAYVLANAPYSLANADGPYKSDTLMDTWSQRATKDARGQRGRQTYAARTKTFGKF